MKEEERAAQLCASLLHSFDKTYSSALVSSCRKVGLHLLKASRLIAPSQRVMRDRPFDGTGNINVFRTISAFCSRGKDISKIVSRKRVVDARVVHLAVLFDDSNSMTAWWRKEKLKKPVKENESPHTFSKIAAIAVSETFGKNANSSTLICFGSKTSVSKKMDYNKLVALNGSGATRLDLALGELKKLRWERRGGKKFLLVLTDGVPEAGNENPKEDGAIQSASAALLAYYARLGIKAIYVTLAHEKSLAEKKIGAHNCKSFSQYLEKKGVITAQAESAKDIGRTLFHAFKSAVAS